MGRAYPEESPARKKRRKKAREREEQHWQDKAGPLMIRRVEPETQTQDKDSTKQEEGTE
jgi:hypothetical protein